jgi:DNA primase
LAAADVATLEGRARAAEAGADIVAQHPSDLVRDQYVMKLAGELDIDADRLRDTVARHRKDLASGTARPGTSTRASRDEAPPTRRPAVKVDRRELDVLLYAVHEPELVVDWLDERLFVDPLTRGAFEAIAASDSIHDAIASTEDPVRDLLERVAVEEPIASDEPETLRAHLMANTIQPAAQRVLAGMLRAGDERSTSLKLLLDALAHARESGDWEAVQEDSFELLGWLGEATRGAGRA